MTGNWSHPNVSTRFYEVAYEVVIWGEASWHKVPPDLSLLNAHRYQLRGRGRTGGPAWLFGGKTVLGLAIPGPTGQIFALRGVTGTGGGQ